MPSELFIYGIIGETDLGEVPGVLDQDVVEALLSLPPSDGLDIRINTIGGSVGEGMAMMNSIRTFATKQLALNKDFKLRTIVDGFAYSSGTLLMLAADVRIMNPGTKAMVHNPMTGVFGNYKDFEVLAKEYKRNSVYMAELYASATRKELAMWEDLMDAETFLTPEEAVAVGLATEAKKYEPLAKARNQSAVLTPDPSPQKESPLLFPSMVFEKDRDQLIGLSKPGAYKNYIQSMRAKPKSGIIVSPQVQEVASSGEKNSSLKLPPNPDQLKLEQDYDIMMRE